MKKRLIICLASLFFMILCCPLHAHGGHTDAAGGHYDHSNGEYHYHHGYPAHQHRDIDGDGKKDCPYDFDDKTDHRSNLSSKGRSDSDVSKSSEDYSDIIPTIFLLGITALLILLKVIKWL